MTEENKELTPPKPPIIIDIKNIDTKAIKNAENFVQYEAFKDLTTFLTHDLNKKVKKKDKYYNQRTHNTIFVNGERGSGKTQFLLSIRNYLEKDLEKELYFFTPIDPTLLHDNESFLTIIIAKILNNLENNKKLSNLTSDEKKIFYKLLSNISKAIDGVINNKNESRTALEDISQDQTSLKLEEYLHDFFCLTTEILKKERLVLLIDDVDMALDKGFEVLEVIRKYLSSPYIIPIVTGNEKLYLHILKNNFDKHKLKGEDKKTLAIDYLVKVFPLNYRIKIKTLWELSENNLIVFRLDSKGYVYSQNEDLMNIEEEKMKELKIDKKIDLFDNLEKNSDLNLISGTIIENFYSFSLRAIVQISKREIENNFDDFLKNLKSIEKIKKDYNYEIISKDTIKNIYIEEAQNMLLDSKHQEAIVYFKKAIIFDNNDFDIYAFLGLAYFEIFSYKESIGAYLKSHRVLRNNKSLQKIDENEKIILKKLAESYLKLFESKLIDDNFKEIEKNYKDNFLINFEKDDNIMKIFRVFNRLYNLSKETDERKKYVDINTIIDDDKRKFGNTSYDWSFYSIEKWIEEKDNRLLLAKLKKIKFTSGTKVLTLRDFEYHRIEFCKKSNNRLRKYFNEVIG